MEGKKKVGLSRHEGAEEYMQRHDCGLEDFLNRFENLPQKNWYGEV